MNMCEQVTGRLLPQPHLQYGKPGSLDTGTRGAWNLEGIKFLKGGEIKGWGIVNFAHKDRVLVPGEQGKHVRVIQGFHAANLIVMSHEEYLDDSSS